MFKALQTSSKNNETCFQFCATGEAEHREEIAGKIFSFEHFLKDGDKSYKTYYIKCTSDSVSMFKLGDIGNKVLEFLLFINVHSDFGFLRLVRVEKRPHGGY